MNFERKIAVTILVGTRPNFIKVTRFKELAPKFNMEVTIIHTGQHYDEKMANIFFDQFELRPDVFLNIEPASPNQQIAEIILKLESYFTKNGKPDLFIVPGDVNSTLAGAICANKMGIKLAHLESGLRSFDKTMPEEHNRVLTDHLSNICFVTEESGLNNIKEEKIQAEVYFVGNTMIDSMVKFEDKIQSSSIVSELGVEEDNFCLMTFHRPSNVDGTEGLKMLSDLIAQTSEKIHVVIPLHPRTKKMMTEFDMLTKIEQNEKVTILEPLGYFEFQKLVASAKFILTDSGGIQEESTYRQVPCLTLRPNTERPITCDIGSNTLLEFDLIKIKLKVEEILQGNYKYGQIPELWDGQATHRIMNHIQKVFKN